jgi:hypothetical protein
VGRAPCGPARAQASRVAGSVAGVDAPYPDGGGFPPPGGRPCRRQRGLRDGSLHSAMAYDPQSAVAVGQHPAAVPPMGLPLPCWRSSEVGACPCDAPSSARRGGRGRVPGVPEELELIESPIIGGEEENRDGGLVSTAAAEAESSGQRVATPKRCTGRPRACTQPRKCAGSWRQEIRNLSTVGGEHQDQALPAASRQLRSTMNPQFAPPSARRVGELPRRVRSCYFRTGVTDVLAMFHPPRSTAPPYALHSWLRGRSAYRASGPRRASARRAIHHS